MDNLEQNIFGGKKFKDLLEEIYNNQKQKSRQINALIKELAPLANDDISSATLIVPLIKEYLEIDVKNDEQLIKVAAIIQKCLTVSGDKSNPFEIPKEELDQLMKEIDKLDSKK